MLVTLTHVLLPKLAVLEVIEWGRDENSSANVRLATNCDRFWNPSTGIRTNYLMDGCRERS
jgi:hypothetical protein